MISIHKFKEFYKLIREDDYIDVTYNCWGRKERFIGKVSRRTGKMAVLLGFDADGKNKENYRMKILPSGHFTTYHNSALLKILTVNKLKYGEFQLEVL